MEMRFAAMVTADASRTQNRFAALGFGRPHAQFHTPPERGHLGSRLDQGDASEEMFAAPCGGKLSRQRNKLYIMLLGSL